MLNRTRIGSNQSIAIWQSQRKRVTCLNLSHTGRKDTDIVDTDSGHIAATRPERNKEELLRGRGKGPIAGVGFP